MNGSNNNFFKKTITALSIGFNKGIVLSKITGSAMKIIAMKIFRIQESLETVVASFEEIRATSESTSNNTNNIFHNMNFIIESTSSINQSIQKNVGEMTNAADESRKLHKLLSSLTEKTASVSNMTAKIDDVAQQTNILAINASIEAARAGSSGKGFHIIAKEVRNLSEQTQEFANSISGTIKDFSSGIEQFERSFENLMNLLNSFQHELMDTGETFNNHKNSLEHSGHMLAEIKSGISEQTSAINDGFKSLEKVFELLKDTTTISESLERSHTSLDQLLNREN